MLFSRYMTVNGFLAAANWLNHMVTPDDRSTIREARASLLRIEKWKARDGQVRTRIDQKELPRNARASVTVCRIPPPQMATARGHGSRRASIQSVFTYFSAKWF
jgi:hypothetical protein